MASPYVCLICQREIPSLDAACPYCRSRVPSTVGASPRTLGAVALAMVVLLVLTGYLSGWFHEAEQMRGLRLAERGHALTEAGDYGAAIDEYREALTYTPDSLDYRLNLAVALEETGRIGEAETHFNQCLAIDSTLAVPNLHLARIAAGRADLERATMHYRRALYGRWPSDPVEQRIKTRFELVSLLEKQGERMQGVAELLELLEEQPDNADLASRAAWSLLNVGAPSRALEVFERLIERDPRDAVAHSGVAEAEFALDHFLTARTYFRRALAMNPGLTHLQARLALCDRINALDPTVRGLGRVTRYRRSVEIVRQVVSILEACVSPVGPFGPEPPIAIPEAADDVAAARAVLDGDVAAGADDDLTEANIGLAERLWQVRADACPEADRDAPALSALLGKLAIS